MQRGMDLGSFALLGGALLSFNTACVRKPKAVTCTVTYGGEARRLEFPEASDPYGASAVDISGRFRFKVSYLRAASRAATINVYAYQQVDGGNVLLQEGKYTAPLSLAGTRYGFTGRQLVYSASERELEYWCELSP